MDSCWLTILPVVENFIAPHTTIQPAMNPANCAGNLLGFGPLASRGQSVVEAVRRSIQVATSGTVANAGRNMRRKVEQGISCISRPLHRGGAPSHAEAMSSRRNIASLPEAAAVPRPFIDRESPREHEREWKR
jgi:hypothetical protein